MKRSFSLIEILVGMVLFSILASLLMGLYIGVSRNVASQKKQEAVLEQFIFLHTMLQKSLSHAIFDTKGEGLQEEDGNLYFTFDNGIDPDPLFSSTVKGLLALRDGNFILEVKPLTSSESRLYTLKKNVYHISFEQLPEEGMPLALQISLDEELYTVLFENQPSIVLLK